MTRIVTAVLVVAGVFALAGCAGFVRPYDPLTDQPTTLIGGEPIDPSPIPDPVDDPRDRAIDAIERRMGIGLGAP